MTKETTVSLWSVPVRMKGFLSHLCAKTEWFVHSEINLEFVKEFKKIYSHGIFCGYKRNSFKCYLVILDTRVETFPRQEKGFKNLSSKFISFLKICVYLQRYRVWLTSPLKNRMILSWPDSQLVLTNNRMKIPLCAHITILRSLIRFINFM